MFISSPLAVGMSDFEIINPGFSFDIFPVGSIP
jgi:hypothetical protein